MMEDQKIEIEHQEKRSYVKMLSQQAINQVINEVLNNKIAFGQQKMQLHNQSPINRSNNNPELKINQIIKRRQALILEKARLNAQILLSNKSQNKIILRKPMQKSFITQAQIKVIKKTIEANKQFQLKVLKQSQLIEKKKRQKDRQQSQKIIYNMQQIKQKRRNVVIKNLERLQNIKNQRQQKLKFCNRQFQEVKAKKFLHEALQEKAKKQKQTLEEAVKKTFQQKIKQTEFSYEKIQKHQNQYLSKLTNISTERKQQIRKLNKQQKQFQNNYMQKHRPSKFLQILIAEQQKKEQIQQNKAVQCQNLYKKKIKYGQQLRLKLKKKKHISPQDEIQQQEQQKQIPRSKSLLQINAKGNTYMRQVHSSVSNLAIKRDKQKMIQKRKKSQMIKYPNYLQQINKKFHSLKQTPLNKEVAQIKNILQKQTPNNQKLSIIQLATKKMDNLLEHNNIDEVVKSLYTKIKIINAFKN